MENGEEKRPIPFDRPCPGFAYPRAATADEISTMFNDFKAQGWKYEGVTAPGTPGGQEILLIHETKMELLFYPFRWAFTSEISAAKCANTRKIKKGERLHHVFAAREAELARAANNHKLLRPDCNSTSTPLKTTTTMNALVFPAGHVLAGYRAPRLATVWEANNLPDYIVALGWSWRGVSDADIHGDRDILLADQTRKTLIWFPLNLATDEEQTRALEDNEMRAYYGNRADDLFQAHTEGGNESEIRVAHLSLEDDDVWAAEEIIDEDEEGYLIRWAVTDRGNPDSWVAKTWGVTHALLYEWERKKAAQRLIDAAE